MFFVRNRKDFNSRFTLYDSLEHILETVEHSHIVLSFDSSDQLIACGHYWYTSNDIEPNPQGEVVFVSSALIAREQRSSLVFVKGFRDMANIIAEDNRNVKVMQFHAQTDNHYLNRLYGKFARHIGEHEGLNGMENVYAADFATLLNYLNRGVK